MKIEEYLEQKRLEVDQFLEHYIPHTQTTPAILYEAIRYSLFA
ncbi:MAG: geranyl transferase, partial [Nitrospirae bacterium]